MEGNALDLPFPDSSFDAVTIGYGLRNVVDRHRAMTEICRVMKPGSTLSVLDFNKSINPLSTTVQVVVGRLILFLHHHKLYEVIGFKSFVLSDVELSVL